MSGYEIAILAGGRGTRLAAATGGLPKPLVPVNGTSVIERQLAACRFYGFDRCLLLVHHEAARLVERLGDGSAFGLEIGYAHEREPRGTAGALGDALPQLADRFLVLYADTVFDIDLRRFERAHDASGAAATLFLHPNDHPHDSDIVEVDASDRVVRLLGYPHAAGWPRNLVNAALYAFRKADVEPFVDPGRASDIAKDLFPAMLAGGLAIQGYVSPEYIKDMGTPERLAKVERDLESGLPDGLSWRARRRAVFLDRDGTVNREVGHLRSADRLELIPGAGAAVSRLNRAGLLAVLATNQPVVARGDVTVAQLGAIHGQLEALLSRDGAYLDRIDVCPHHPDRGFPGEIPELKVICACRKPATGLVDGACAALEIDRGQSWFVGDTTSDVECGRRSGLRTVLVGTGHGGRDGRHPVLADYECPDLAAAVDWILDGHPFVQSQLLEIVAEAARSRTVLIGGLARAGKSSVARVLAELLHAAGHRAHVIALDGWLRPLEQRREGEGVLARYDVDQLVGDVLPVLKATSRAEIDVPTYVRHLRRAGPPWRRISVGRQDVVILEGVPALLLEPLLQTGALTLQVDIGAAERERRLRVDDRQRGRSSDESAGLQRSRDLDEAPQVAAAASKARCRVRSRPDDHGQRVESGGFAA